MEFSKLSPHQTYPVRSAVLRPGLAIESCMFEGDDLATTHHFGLIDEGEVVAIASLYQAKLEGKAGLQLRGMAVLEHYQGLGLGAKLLIQVEQQAAKLTDLLWANARTGAARFYFKLGYSQASEVFDIAGVGPHIKISKALAD
ncbi:GNAT family N-acetyltransferase [Paraferrimonas sp. SM1919]|uniref:GNAT family N-acetyltransferase n=1 Tax=Paraferrimonas sp. SM1919 TaxID=2662263 RepID=UPI0013D1D7CB|nr:GNAT family N-acetyltransferase [Paraferrimonas sp. SM1919]